MQWNPALQADCSGLQEGYIYCIANFADNAIPMPPTVSTLPSPVQSGIASNCVSWYQMTGSDTCEDISIIFGTFSEADFKSWNPAVGSDCSGLTVSTLLLSSFTSKITKTLRNLPGTALVCLALLRHAPRPTLSLQKMRKIQVEPLLPAKDPRLPLLKVDRQM